MPLETIGKYLIIFPIFSRCKGESVILNSNNFKLFKIFNRIKLVCVGKGKGSWFMHGKNLSQNVENVCSVEILKCLGSKV